MKKANWIIILLATAGYSSAQQLTPSVISTSGGFYASPSASLSFTTGEMAAVETYVTAGNILTQGFQQPWDFGTYIDEHPLQDFSFGVYPNPSSGNIYLLTESPQELDLSIHIVNLLGVELKQFQAAHFGSTSVSPIDITNLPQGTYIVSLLVTDRASAATHTFIKK